MPDGRSKTQNFGKRLSGLPLLVIPLVALWAWQGRGIAPEWLGLPDGILAIFLVLGIQAKPMARMLMIILVLGLLTIGSSFDPKITSLLIPALINLLLALLFGLSLVNGQEALITRIARLARSPQPMTPEHLRYTRRLTRIWGFLFLILAGVALVLALYATPGFSLFFANAINPLIVGVFLILESQFRRRHFPGEVPTPLRRVMAVLARDGWRDPAH